MFLNKHWHANLPRTVFIAIFGQGTEGLGASFYWRCREGLLWYNSREEAERTQICHLEYISPLGTIWRHGYFYFISLFIDVELKAYKSVEKHNERLR